MLPGNGAEVQGCGRAGWAPEQVCYQGTSHCESPSQKPTPLGFPPKVSEGSGPLSTIPLDRCWLMAAPGPLGAIQTKVCRAGLWGPGCRWEGEGRALPVSAGADLWDPCSSVSLEYPCTLRVRGHLRPPPDSDWEGSVSSILLPCSPHRWPSFPLISHVVHWKT